MPTQYKLVNLNSRNFVSDGRRGQKSELKAWQGLAQGPFQPPVAPGGLGLWPYHSDLFLWSCYTLLFVPLKGPFAFFTRALVVAFRVCLSNPG